MLSPKLWLICYNMYQKKKKKKKIWSLHINSLRGNTFNINHSINHCPLAAVYGNTDRSAELYRREGVQSMQIDKRLLPGGNSLATASVWIFLSSQHFSRAIQVCDLLSHTWAGANTNWLQKCRDHFSYNPSCYISWDEILTYVRHNFLF